MLAKEVVRSNKQVDRLHVSKARLSSVGMQLTHQAGKSDDPALFSPCLAQASGYPLEAGRARFPISSPPG